MRARDFHFDPSYFADWRGLSHKRQAQQSNFQEGKGDEPD